MQKINRNTQSCTSVPYMVDIYRVMWVSVEETDGQTLPHVLSSCYAVKRNKLCENEKTVFYTGLKFIVLNALTNNSKSLPLMLSQLSFLTFNTCNRINYR